MIRRIQTHDDDAACDPACRIYREIIPLKCRHQQLRAGADHVYQLLEFELHDDKEACGGAHHVFGGRGGYGRRAGRCRQHSR